MSETTPVLADNDHDEEFEEGQIALGPKAAKPANSYFKRSLKIWTAITTLLSFLVFGLFLGAYIYLLTGPFQSTYPQDYLTRDLAILLVITAILTVPTLFLNIPIFIPMIPNLVMSILALVYAIDMFSRGFPGSSMCYRYKRYPEYKPLPPDPICLKGKTIITIMMLVGGWCTILVGILLIVLFIIRVVALVKSRFWEGKKMPMLPGWKTPTGFTIQVSLSILPTGTLATVVNGQESREVGSSATNEEGQLIET